MAQKTFKVDLDARPTLTVEIKGRGTFEVPLPGSLPLTKMRELMKLGNDNEKAMDWWVAFFREYLGDALDELTADQFKGLMVTSGQLVNLKAPLDKVNIGSTVLESILVIEPRLNGIIERIAPNLTHVIQDIATFLGMLRRHKQALLQA